VGSSDTLVACPAMLTECLIKAALRMTHERWRLEVFKRLAAEIAARSRGL
jgi:hypothetical protein